MYKDIQIEVEEFRTEHRPILIAEIEKYDGGIDPTNKMIGTEIEFKIKNIGDRAAFQTRLRQHVANLNTPEDMYTPHSRCTGL